MQKKTITIREDQETWVQQSNLNLSRFVQDNLDDRMGPTEDELEEAYRRTAERDKQLYNDWEGASREANRYLGNAPEVNTRADDSTGEQ